MEEVSLSPVARVTFERYTYVSFKALREDCIGRIIGRGLWLPRSPDLPPSDCLWCDAILKKLKPEEKSFFINPLFF
jgi:hypothetical protein